MAISICALLKKMKMKNENGLALVLVLSIVTLIIAFIAETIYQSQINAISALGERDREKAEMSAITGAQFAKMLITLDSNLKNLPPQFKEIAKNFVGDKKIYKMIDGIPIGAEGMELVKDLSKLNLNSLLDESLLNALKVVPGYFVLNVTNESAKLNLNLAANSSQKKGLESALWRIFSLPRESKFLEEKGFPPKRLAANIVDYIDDNTTDSLAGGQEESQYTKYNYLHKPKNAPLESIEELRRIPGFNDDEIFDIFSPYFTVWPHNALDKSLDFNEAAIELIAALVTKEGNDVSQQGIDKLEDDRNEGTLIDEEKRGRAFNTYLKELAGAGDVPNDIANLLGIESNVFKIQVRGSSNGVERTYEMVIDRSKPVSKDAPPIRVIYQRFL